MDELLRAIIVGLITGLFTAGTVWGVLRTEMRFLRRDVDELKTDFKLHIFKGVKP